MDRPVKIFPTPNELAENFAEVLICKINKSIRKRKSYSIALSGGSTPELLFSVLGDQFSDSVQWEFVHLFWGDERCVSPDNPESNFGMTRSKLLDKINIPSGNIHRIRGEADPEEEVLRYSEEIIAYTGKRDVLPLFDQIILGLGEDGHTASIFPDNLDLLNSDKICEVTLHPVTMQNRITLTGRVINNADAVTFLVTGKKKAHILESIFKRSTISLSFPASYILPVYGKLSWYIDEDANLLL